ncbi:unnamed protein product, partial [Allacma fusca]
MRSSCGHILEKLKGQPVKVKMISTRAKKLLAIAFTVSERVSTTPYCWNEKKCRPEITHKKKKI